MKCDQELLGKRTPINREVANAARDFLCARGIAQQDIDIVWTAIALHTTPGIPFHR